MLVNLKLDNLFNNISFNVSMIDLNIIEINAVIYKLDKVILSIDKVNENKGVYSSVMELVGNTPIVRLRKIEERYNIKTQLYVNWNI